MRLWLSILSLSCLIVLMTSNAFSYQVKPISISLEASGRNSTKDIKVINNSTAPIAIRVSMVSRHQNLDGSELNRPAGSLFMVYPQQMVVGAQSAQSVRLQWLGDTSVSLEKSYRFIIEQVPVSLEYSGTANRAMEFNITMKGALYIRPSNAKSNIIVKGVKAQGSQLSLVLENHGKVHSLLRSLVLTLKQGNRVVTLRGKQIYQMEGKNVLAGASRRFMIPRPAGFDVAQPITASLKYSETDSY